MSKTYIAISALIGTIIGAGFLGIPYVVMKSGYVIGLMNMLVIFFAMMFIKLYLGEVALRTKDNHQLTGYAEKYLGKTGKNILFFATIFGIYSAILAYLIAQGQSLSFIFSNSTDYQFYFGVAFWAILSIISYFGISALKKGESIGIILIFAMIILISVLYWNKIDVSNLTYSNPSLFYVPFGVILFAFLGYSAIPEVKRILNDEKKSMKKTIIIANIISLIVYAIFTAIVLGLMGRNTPSLATLALGKPFVLLSIITIFSSYLALSVALIDTFVLDFKKSKIIAWLYTILVPLLIYSVLELTGTANFIKVIGLGGVVSGGLVGITTLFMVKAAKKNGDRKPEYSIPCPNILSWILMIIFASGVILEIFSTLSHFLSN